MVSDWCVDWRTRRYPILNFGQYQNNSNHNGLIYPPSSFFLFPFLNDDYRLPPPAGVERYFL